MFHLAPVSPTVRKRQVPLRNGNDFTFWKKQVLIVLKVHKLERVIDGHELPFVPFKRLISVASHNLTKKVFQHSKWPFKNGTTKTYKHKTCFSAQLIQVLSHRDLCYESHRPSLHCNSDFHFSISLRFQHSFSKRIPVRVTKV